MKITIEISPKDESDLEGAWLVTVTRGDQTQTREHPDVTYALEAVGEEVSLALEAAYPGVDEAYR